MDVTVDTEGVNGIKLRMAVFANPKLPFLQETMDLAADIFGTEIRARAVGGIKKGVRAGYVRNKGNQILATVSVFHPGGRSMEFGREHYYKGFKGNNSPGQKRAKGSMKAGRRFSTRFGQHERVYVGIRRGDAAIGASQERVAELFNNAVLAEWEKRQGGAG